MDIETCFSLCIIEVISFQLPLHFEYDQQLPIESIANIFDSDEEI